MYTNKQNKIITISNNFKLINFFLLRDFNLDNNNFISFYKNLMVFFDEKKYHCGPDLGLKFNSYGKLDKIELYFNIEFLNSNMLDDYGIFLEKNNINNIYKSIKIKKSNKDDYLSIDFYKEDIVNFGYKNIKINIIDYYKVSNFKNKRIEKVYKLNPEGVTYKNFYNIYYKKRQNNNIIKQMLINYKFHDDKICNISGNYNEIGFGEKKLVNSKSFFYGSADYINLLNFLINLCDYFTFNRLKLYLTEDSSCSYTFGYDFNENGNISQFSLYITIP